MGIDERKLRMKCLKDKTHLKSTQKSEELKTHEENNEQHKIPFFDQKMRQEGSMRLKVQCDKTNKISYFRSKKSVLKPLLQQRKQREFIEEN